MNSETLSQEEVDTLLHGAKEEDGESAGSSAAETLRTYALSQKGVTSYQPMPTLDVIHEHFAHYLRIGLSEFIRRDVVVSALPVQIEEYSEFIRQLALPANLNLIQVKPFRGLGFLICEPELVFLTVDNLFGSDGRYHTNIEGRDFTPTEQRIMRRLLEVVFVECQKAWRSIYPIELVYLRSETNIQFASIVAPTEAVVVLTLQVDLGTGGGKLYLCLPYSMIEPIRDILSSTVQIERSDGDSNWTQQLAQELRAADMELTATLTHAQVTVKQLLYLEKGDVITLEIPKTVVVDVAGVPVLECEYGTLQGKYALKVERVLTGTQQLTEPPLSREVEPHNE